MSNRPTPETDAFAIKFKTTCGEKYWVPVDIARKLERERDEYAETLESVASGKYCGGVTKFIRNRHPELAP